MKSKGKTILLDGAKGLAVGAACIIPGVSGGTIAILLNIYNKILEGTNLFFKHFCQSMRILLPIAIGMVVSILALWFPLKYAFEYIMFAIICLFAGFIAGGLPGIVDKVKNKKFKLIYIISIIITVGISVTLGVLSVNFELDMSQAFATFPVWLYFVMIPVGIVTAVALVVPGISGSMFLLVIGFYTPILNIFDSLKGGNWSNIGPIIGVLGCLAIGVIIGFFSIAKLMSVLLKKCETGTMWGIIGFIIGSFFSLFYNFEIVTYYQTNGPKTWEIILGIVLLIVGLVLSYLLVRYRRKIDNSLNTIKE